MKRRDRFAVAGLVLMLAIVGGAMYATDYAESPEPTPIYATPPPAVTYREGVVGHPSSINPLTASTQVDRDLVALLFRGLLRAGPNGTLLPDLARSWAVSPDGLTYTFNMRTDARWEDGQPVTAADVVFTVGLAQDPDYDGPLGGVVAGDHGHGGGFQRGALHADDSPRGFPAADVAADPASSISSATRT